MFTGNYNVVDRNGKVYFSGTYWECDKWRYRNCKDASYIDRETLEEYEVFRYYGVKVYLQKKEG